MIVLNLPNVQVKFEFGINLCFQEKPNFLERLMWKLQVSRSQLLSGILVMTLVFEGGLSSYRRKQGVWMLG